MTDMNYGLTRRNMLQLGGAVVAFCLTRVEPVDTLLSSFEITTSLENTIQGLNSVDHLVLGVSNLEQGIYWVEKTTGVKAVVGGKHPAAGTQNALLSFGRRQYLEILAPDPEQSQIVSRFGDLTQLLSPRLITWAAATRDINALMQKARAAGYEIEGPRDGSRARPDGRLLKWKTMSIRNQFGGVIPFFIEWSTDVVHPAEDSPTGCQLSAFELEHPEPGKISDMLGKLGIEMKVKPGKEGQLKAVLATPKGKVELS